MKPPTENRGTATNGFIGGSPGPFPLSWTPIVPFDDRVWLYSSEQGSSKDAIVSRPTPWMRSVSWETDIEKQEVEVREDWLIWMER
jgi:hypothetical protein